MWIDTHCHLNHERYEGRNPADIIQDARAAGVEGMLTINVLIAQEFDTIRTIARAHDKIWCTVGTHPHDAGQADEQAVDLDHLIALCRSDNKVIGIGETGLDYYYNHSTPDEQQASFRKHIRAALETDLPLVIHGREADDDIIRILKEEGAGDRKLRGVMHCFSSGARMAERSLEIGFYLSFSGIITFKKAQELQAIAAQAPADRILVETDAPFLAPEPHRGKMNAPAFVPLVGQKLAALRGVSDVEMARQTTQNFYTLFSKAA
ncbi:MAG: TatD family hydrolase [Alphaproteobacteria bacterium]|nr:TatD family hydrolase [Alphaproteobacteria bacterium]